MHPFAKKYTFWGQKRYSVTVLQFQKPYQKGQKYTLYLYINIEVFLG